MDFKVLLAAILFPFFALAQDTTKLREVEIKENRKGNFGHLYQVDGMKLTAGKKSEVIDVEMLTVNKATNNTRQVYAKVAGLNIFENDGSGLQLSIGGRGLDPNRTANFNVRQNGYDISADALGYPESYYTPPAEALKKIEIIKGAASLQYGTQFGGLLNFQMKQPEDRTKKIGVESKQTIGSFGFMGSFNSIGGKVGKLSYYAYIHYKKGDGWRPNSSFESFNAYADVHYQLSEKHKIGVEYSHLQYLSQQPGGLTDAMFEKDPRQSNRSRNWFAVRWNLLDVEWDYQISARTRLQTRAFGLMAERNAIGFRQNRPALADDGTGARDLLKGTFNNVTLESRLLHRYSIGRKSLTLLTGIRAYKGYSTSIQGNVFNGSGADFTFPGDESTLMLHDYKYPNLNYAAFAENIIRITDKWNVTPGIRAEYINTQAVGNYHYRGAPDLTGAYHFDSVIYEHVQRPRSFVIAGIGSSYKFKPQLEAYGNISQNYRSVTFSDIRTTNPSFEIDPNIRDERGYSADLGLRGGLFELLQFDANVFFLHYANRIGEYNDKKGNLEIRKRANAGVADIGGIESFVEVDLIKLLSKKPQKWTASLYSNFTFTTSKYRESPRKDIVGKQVEYVPMVNWKTGLQATHGHFLKFTFQYSYLSEQFSDATNARESSFSAVNGIIPSYAVMDVSAGYNWRRYSIEASINNLAGVSYFTRRATGYPGPGIISGEGRSFYITLGINTF